MTLQRKVRIDSYQRDGEDKGRKKKGKKPSQALGQFEQKPNLNVHDIVQGTMKGPWTLQSKQRGKISISFQIISRE